MEKYSIALDADLQDEIASLVQTLHETQKRLQELTGGEVDAVVHPGGYSYLLHEAQEDLRLSETMQRQFAATQSSILNALPAHIALLDEKGVIISVNEGWRQFAGNNSLADSGSGVGLNYLDVCESANGKCAEEAHAVATGIRSVLSGASSGFSLDYPRHSPNEQRWFRLRVNSIEIGGCPAAVVMHLDITEGKLAEEAVRASEVGMAAAQRLAHLGSWTLDLTDTDDFNTNALRWSDEMFRIAGYEPGAVEVSNELFFRLVPEEEHEEIRRAVEEAIRERVPYSIIHRLIRPDEDERIIHETAQILYDEKTGQPLKMVGTAQDITERHATEEALEKSAREQRGLVALLEKARTKLVTAQEVAKIGSWDTEIATGQVVWSRETHRIFETDPATFHPTHPGVLQLVHPEDRAMVDEAFQRGLASRSACALVYRIVMPDGRSKTVEERWQTSFDEHGQANAVVGTCQDITERCLATDLLMKSQRRLTLATESANLGIWDWDIIANKMLWDDRMYELYGIREQDFSGAYDAWHKGLHPEDRERGNSAIAAAISGAEDFNIQFRVVWPTGEVRHIEARAVVQRADAGAATRMTGVNWDITERKTRERELASAHRALKMLSTCNEALIRAEHEQELLDRICRIAVDTGGYCMAWVGYAQDDEIRSIKPAAHAGAADGYLAEIKVSWNENDPLGQGPAGQVIRTGKSVVCPDFTLDSTLAHWHALAERQGFRGIMLLPLSDGQRTFGFLGLYSAEVNDPCADELRLLQELADDLAFGIVHLRASLDQQRLQAAVLQVAAGVSGASGTEFFEHLARHMAEALGAHAGFVSQLRAGEPLSASTLAAVVDGKVMANFDYLIEGTPCENLAASDSCVIAQLVAEQFPQAERLAALGVQAYVGRRLDDSTGQPLGHLFAVFREPLGDSAFATSTMRIFAARAASELERLQTDAQVREQAALIDEARDAILVCDLDHRINFWSKGAERLYGWSAEDARGRLVQELLEIDHDTLAEADRAVRQSGSWNGEFQKRTRDQTVLTLNGRWTLMRDADGQPRSILSIDTDITEQKQVETQFLRAQRMESIGTLAGGIAHDLNNVLGPILMALDLLNMKITDPASRELIAMVGSSARRGADMVRQILSFSLGVEGRRMEVQIKHLILEIEKIANDTFLKNVEVWTVFPKDLWIVTGDPTQIHQVLLNLCVNARDAMPEGGNLKIAAENRVLDKNAAAGIPGARPGPYVFLQVEDTGTGMPPEVVAKIFDPFFTTKELGKGTGLGLSTSMAIVKSHGGFIDVDSRPGNGTSFKLYLPAQTEESAARSAEAAAEIPRGNGELILVVDDEAMVRQVTKRCSKRSATASFRLPMERLPWPSLRPTVPKSPLW